MATPFDQSENSTSVGAGIDFTDPNSPLARFYVRTGTVASAALIAAVFVILNYTKLWHTDIWGHLRFGQEISNNRSIPEIEPFSTFSDRQFLLTKNAWLSQFGLTQIFDLGSTLRGGDSLDRLAGGVDALRFLLAVLVAVRLILLYWTFVNLTDSTVLAFFGLIFIVATSLGNLGVLRPQVLGEVLFAGLLYLLSQKKASNNRQWSIPLILVAWANIHGSFLVGLLALGSTWVAQLFRLLLGQSNVGTHSQSDQSFRRVTVLLAVSTIGITFLNPDLWHIWTKTFEMARHPNVRVMNEWQPIWAPLAGGARITLLVCLVLIGLAFMFEGGRPSAELVTFTLAFGIPTVLSQRSVVWLITVAPFVALPSFGRVLAEFRPPWWTSVPSLRKSILVLAIAIVSCLWSIPVQNLLREKPQPLAKLVSDGTPLEYAMAVTQPALVSDSKLAKTLAETYPDGKFKGTIFAGDTLGDFFIWTMPSPARVFMYSHVHLFSPEQWQRYVAIRDAHDGWKKLMDQCAINLVVVEAEDKPLICNQLRRNSQWKVIVDEAGLSTKIDPRCRLFVALRVPPISQ